MRRNKQSITPKHSNTPHLDVVGEEPVKPRPGGPEVVHERLHAAPFADFRCVSPGNHPLQRQEDALEEHSENLSRNRSRSRRRSRSTCKNGETNTKGLVYCDGARLARGYRPECGLLRQAYPIYPCEQKEEGRAGDFQA